jgi:hypothetical protein
MSELATTQRRLWRLLTAPSGVGSALAETGDAEGRSLAGWIRSDERGAAAARLEIYAHAYFQRIHDVLARDFPTLAERLGADGFHDLVTAYLCVHPPERPSLRHAGEPLATFLGHDAAAAPFRRRWPFATDLARLEWALGGAFDAPDAAPLERAALAALPPERWESLTFDLHPSARHLALAWDAVALRQAFEADAEPPPPARRAIVALVWRQRERVRFRTLDAEEAALLERVEAGERFGALCAWLAERHGPEAAASRAAGWLAGWVDAELLVATGPPPAAKPLPRARLA